MADQSASASFGGRPRDAGRDVAIREATLALLVEVGYDRLSIESVAARAGVSRPTVYRRHADKAALVAASVGQREAGVRPAANTGSLREDLLHVLRWLSREIAEQELGLLGAVFAGMRSDPDLAAAMRLVLGRDQSAMTDEPLAGARRRGEHLSPQAAALFSEIAPAVLVHRLVVVGKPCDEPYLAHLLDDVLLPLVLS